jgi:hypothetical protein
VFEGLLAGWVMSMMKWGSRIGGVEALTVFQSAADLGENILKPSGQLC